MAEPMVVSSPPRAAGNPAVHYVHWDRLRTFFWRWTIAVPLDSADRDGPPDGHVEREGSGEMGRLP